MLRRYFLQWHVFTGNQTALIVTEFTVLAALAAGAALHYAYGLRPWAFPFDDSYITLTYAKNLVVYKKLIFHPDLAGSGTGATSPLHVFLVAWVTAVSRDLSDQGPIRAALALGVAAHVALTWATFWLSWVLFRDRLVAMIGGCLVGVAGYATYDSLNGLETSLFMLLNVLAVAHFAGDTEGRRPLVTGLLLALATLTRPEAAFLVAAILGFAVWRGFGSPERRRYPILLTIPIAIVVAAYLSYGTATIGTPLLGTALAKLLYFREFTLPPAVHWQFASRAVVEFYKPILLFVPLAIIGGVYWRNRFAWVIVFYLSMFYVLYFIALPGGLDHYWRRYQHIVLPFMFAHASAGLVFLVRFWIRREGLPRGVIVGVAIVIMVVPVISHHTFMRMRFREDVNYSLNVGVKLAKWVEENTLDSAVVATHDIGILGYYSNRRILDLVGLISREALPHHANRSIKEYLIARHPDWLVILPFHDEWFLRIRPSESAERFRFIREFGPIRGGQSFRVYQILYGNEAVE